VRGRTGVFPRKREDGPRGEGNNLKRYVTSDQEIENKHVTWLKYMTSPISPFESNPDVMVINLRPLKKGSDIRMFKNMFLEKKLKKSNSFLTF
jgi:hypothetical protein